MEIKAAVSIEKKRYCFQELSYIFFVAIICTAVAWDVIVAGNFVYKVVAIVAFCLLTYGHISAEYTTPQGVKP